MSPFARRWLVGGFTLVFGFIHRDTQVCGR